ncbi:hypothetical protein TNCV_1121061 [Trichonephila clavipes]|uniref:Uncharacterized protein n=1 Tax=Trichonephila clavipes TaxID=2585209 RepID=A0A8X6VJB4_TRICX|nr:hypothetical protein TNCV_1121061 [Trichonephila clavipes]
MSVAGRLVELLSISIKTSVSDGTERCDVSEDHLSRFKDSRSEICACVAVSISKSPDGNFLIDFTEPAEPCTALEIRKEDQFAGLAPDSATSSGFGRAPHSAMQDPIQAPPEATRQTRLCTS